MKQFLLILTLIISCKTYAENISIGTMAIFHPKENTYEGPRGLGNKYNKFSYLISYENKNLLMIGFQNSFYQETIYIGNKKMFNFNNEIKYGFSYGLSYGYYLGKVFKEDNYVRKKLYDNYDRWDKPILPLMFGVIEYKITKSQRLGVIITPQKAFSLLYDFNFSI